MNRASDVFRRHVLLIAAVIVAVVAGWRWGGGAAWLTLLLAAPVLAWRYDNRTGAFLSIAILFFVACAILMVLVALLSMAHHG